jgi:hypothetical protein
VRRQNQSDTGAIPGSVVRGSETSSQAGPHRLKGVPRFAAHCGQTGCLRPARERVILATRRKRMRTFADLKRTIKPGMKLLVLQHDYRPELTGTVRTVTRTQGNGYFFTDEHHKSAFSNYAKASCYTFPDERTYRHDEGALCSCGNRNLTGDVKHSQTCNVTTGKRFAWTIQIV